MAKAPGCDVTVSCSDEKTGIQALSNLKTEPARPGQCERIDPEYKRNGTTCLIASREVSTGKINAFQLGKSRKEEDYLDHVKQIVSNDPEGKHIIICDQLNIHKSASLVQWVAQQNGHSGDLGDKKKRKGILGNQKNRMKFLEDKNHRIRFLYTPKHCSWMNQIENWFGLLERKVVKHGQFKSVLALEEKVAAFIQYYCAVLAKPYNWKSNGEKYRHKLMN